MCPHPSRRGELTTAAAGSKGAQTPQQGASARDRHEALAHARFLPSLCENAKTLDRDRTSYAFNAALAAQAGSPSNFEIEPENIILIALRVF